MTKKILIIEDDNDNLEIMTYILREEGYEVLTSADSSLLLDIHQYKPNLILLDNKLKDSSGHEICKKFKAEPATAAYPIILVSAHIELEALAKDSQADGYLEKPYSIDALIAIVKKFA